MMTSPSLITGPAPSFWAEQDRVIDSPPILRARPEDGRHDQLGIFQTALLGRITQASTLMAEHTAALSEGTRLKNEWIIAKAEAFLAAEASISRAYMGEISDRGLPHRLFPKT